jgi:hypothetical protein
MHINVKFSAKKNTKKSGDRPAKAIQIMIDKML